MEYSSLQKKIYQRYENVYNTMSTCAYLELITYWINIYILESIIFQLEMSSYYLSINKKKNAWINWVYYLFFHQYFQAICRFKKSRTHIFKPCVSLSQVIFKSCIASYSIISARLYQKDGTPYILAQVFSKNKILVISA